MNFPGRRELGTGLDLNYGSAITLHLNFLTYNIRVTTVQSYTVVVIMKVKSSGQTISSGKPSVYFSYSHHVY